MANYLITGGAGFIGINYLEYALEEYPNDRFICLDALTYAANKSKIDELMKYKNLIFMHGNICDKKLINNIFKNYNIDYVVNFAAESHVDRSIEDSTIFIKTNVEGVQVLLDACRIYNIKRFHQVSTDEVYGDLAFDSDIKFNELSKLNPSNPYSASKASADLLVLSYHRTYGLNITISRSCNNYGPYQHKEKLVPKVIYNALNDIDIPIYGNGKNKRNWIYVLDNAKAIDCVLRYGKNGEIYNISSNNEIENLDLVGIILSYLNKSNKLIKFVEDRLGHDLRYSIDNSKLIKELNFNFEYDMTNGLLKTINWYKNNL